MRYKVYKIKNLCEINKRSLNKKDKLDVIHYLDTSNLTDGQIEEIKILKPGVDKIPSRAKRKVQEDDILYSTVRPNQRHYGYIEKGYEHLIVSTGFAVLSPKKEIVDPYYLYCYLTLDHIVEYLQVIAENNTSTYPSIKPSDIGELEIELPDLKTQKSISNLLKNLNRKLDINNQIISNLEQLAQTLFKHWFIDFEFPNEHGEPYRSSGGEMKSSKLGEIPIHFDIKKADELGSFKNGINYNRNTLGDSLFKIINVRNLVGNQFFVKDELETISIDHDKAKDYIVQQGDILIARSANPGETVYINSHDDSTIFSGFIIRFRVKNPLLRQYLFQYVLRLKNNLNAYSSGTTLQNINQQILKNLEIVIPTDDVLVKFNKITVTLFNAIEEKKKENNKLALLRDTLLPKLLSGEIELPDEDEVTEDVMVQ